jgi:pterin-4a-carbinolamine dehydratase
MIWSAAALASRPSCHAFETDVQPTKDSDPAANPANHHPLLINRFPMTGFPHTS